jgi:ABC-type enterochelin transport system permease subunit
MKKGSDSKENGFMDEIVLTFSNKKSLLSSKKIERFIVFNVFLVLTVLYVWKNIDTLEARDFIEITLVWLAYGGYNSFMSFRDKKLDANQEPGPPDGV